MTNTLFIGKVYHRFDELPSTNDYARDMLAKSKPPEGTAVRADSQSAGRGQYGSQWASAPGQNLLLSIILYPTWLAATEQWLLSEAVAVAVRETVDLCLTGHSTLVPQQSTRVTAADLPPAADRRQATSVKWPNDIYIGPRKTAGILIQNTLSSHFLQASIVGIGLNVNQLAFPPEVPNATSLARLSGQHFDLETVANTLFACVEHRYIQLKNGGKSTVQAEYRRHLLGLAVERTFARPDGSRFVGVIQDVANDGRLLIRTAAGTETFGVREVVQIQPQQIPG